MSTFFIFGFLSGICAIVATGGVRITGFVCIAFSAFFEVVFVTLAFFATLVFLASTVFEEVVLEGVVLEGVVLEGVDFDVGFISFLVIAFWTIDCLTFLPLAIGFTTSFVALVFGLGRTLVTTFGFDFITSFCGGDFLITFLVVFVVVFDDFAGANFLLLTVSPTFFAFAFGFVFDFGNSFFLVGATSFLVPAFFIATVFLVIFFWFILINSPAILLLLIVELFRGCKYRQ